MVRDSQATLDAALEKIGQLVKDKDAAQYHLTRFLLAHPELEDDKELLEARLALV